jgi:uncharacterized protein (TIGR00297 family)
LPSKAIPPNRDRLQSRWLVWTVAPLLGLSALLVVVQACLGPPRISNFHTVSIVISIAFALLVWRIKAATPSAAVCGGMICLLLTICPLPAWERPYSALAPLVALFILTHVTTMVGHKHKVGAGLTHPHDGRNIAQVIANLGIAALLAFPVGQFAVDMTWGDGHNYQYPLWVIAVLVLSALTEATADTVASEIGQAFGGRPVLLTTLRRVEPGADGAISVWGTLAGVFAAVIVAAAGAWSMHLTLQQSSIALVAGVCGLMFDTLLGATLERNGWIGNNVVNFFSTAFSPAICFIALRFIPGIGPRPFVRY